jgi:hypothetical protein
MHYECKFASMLGLRYATGSSGGRLKMLVQALESSKPAHPENSAESIRATLREERHFFL